MLEVNVTGFAAWDFYFAILLAGFVGISVVSDSFNEKSFSPKLQSLVG